MEFRQVFIICDLNSPCLHDEDRYLKFLSKHTSLEDAQKEVASWKSTFGVYIVPSWEAVRE